MYSSMDTGGYPSELPHSVISGSQTMCVYPKLIAAYHDLLRLLMPRHSPCTLYSLIFKVTLFSILQLKWFFFTFSYMQFSKNRIERSFLLRKEKGSSLKIKQNKDFPKYVLTKIVSW